MNRLKRLKRLKMWVKYLFIKFPKNTIIYDKYSYSIRNKVFNDLDKLNKFIKKNYKSLKITPLILNLYSGFEGELIVPPNTIVYDYTNEVCLTTRTKLSDWIKLKNTCFGSASKKMKELRKICDERSKDNRCVLCGVKLNKNNVSNDVLHSFCVGKNTLLVYNICKDCVYGGY